MFESFAAMSIPGSNVKDAPTQKAGNPPLFPITLGSRRYFPLFSGAPRLPPHPDPYYSRRVSTLPKIMHPARWRAAVSVTVRVAAVVEGWGVGKHGRRVPTSPPKMHE